jgi:hypothetical protein
VRRGRDGKRGRADYRPLEWVVVDASGGGVDIPGGRRAGPRRERRRAALARAAGLGLDAAKARAR